VQPALTDHWQDVTAAFHDEDAHHLYVPPEQIVAQLDARVLIRLSSIDQDQPFAFRAQAADIAARGLKEAEPELEKLARSGYQTVLTFARRGEGERFAYNLGRLKTRWLGEGEVAPAQAGQITMAHARLQAGFIAPQFHLAVIPDHRLFRRRRAPDQPEQRTRRRGVLRSFADLRTGDIVVHEDHGIARFAGFDTKTVAGVTRDYLYLEYAGSDRVFEAACKLDPKAETEIVVNLQGDFPTISPQNIRDVLPPLSDPAVDIATLAAEIHTEEESLAPSVVKAVGSPLGGRRMRALYFTRATAPHGDGPRYHHIGLYAYRRAALARFVKLPPSPLELQEKLEQLRALEAGMRIDITIVDTVPRGVDTPADLETARRILAKL